MGIVDVRDLHKSLQGHGSFVFFVDWWSSIIVRHQLKENVDYFIMGVYPDNKNKQKKMIWLPIRTAVTIARWYLEKKQIKIDVVSLVKYDGLFYL